MSAPFFPKTSPCMLGPKLAGSCGSLFCLDICSTINCFHLRQQPKKTRSYLLSGWGAVQPNPGLIHSLSAPGGLLALLDLSCPLSVHSYHFSRPRVMFLASVGDPDSQINAYFSSKDNFLSASKVSLSPAHPVLQLTRCWEVCVSLQAAC